PSAPLQPGTVRLQRRLSGRDQPAEDRWRGDRRRRQPSLRFRLIRCDARGRPKVAWPSDTRGPGCPSIRWFQTATRRARDRTGHWRLHANHRTVDLADRDTVAVGAIACTGTGGEALRTRLWRTLRQDA